MKKILYISLVLTIFLTACKKDSDIFIPDSGIVNFIPAAFGGVITDEFNSPLEAAKVSIGDNETTTDINGIFQFKNIAVNETRAYLTIEKNGFFTGSKAIIPQNAILSPLTIKLLSSGTIASIDSQNGGDIDIAGGAKMVIPSNAVARTDGNTYDGIVSIAARYLDPTDADFGRKIPGNSTGINAFDQEQFLQNYGMLNVRFTGNNGSELTLQEDQKITLNFPLSDQLLTNAPNTIALWFFDETTGLWNEEGTAELVNNNYVGEVDRPGFWACNVAYPLTNIKGRLVNVDDEALSFSPMRIKFQDNSFISSDICSATGVFTANIPADQDLSLEVLDLCDEVIFIKNLGSFNAFSDLQNISVNNVSDFSIISGQLKNCQNTAVKSGYVQITSGSGSAYLFAENNGHFAAQLNLCNDDDITLTAFDLDYGKQSTPQIYEALENIDADNIEVCDEQGEYVDYTLDGSSFLLTDAAASQNTFGVTNILAEATANHSEFTFSFEGTTTGEFAFQPVFSINDLSPQEGSNPQLNTTISFYGEVGDWIIGSFQGSFTDSDNINHEVDGQFKVVRDQ